VAAVAAGHLAGMPDAPDTRHDDSSLTIGELSRLTGTKPTTIRWYEQEGVLHPSRRTAGGHRVYGGDHLRRLGFVRHARELGFPIAAIRDLLGFAATPQADCGRAHAIATAQVADIDRRLRRLVALRAEVARMAETCSGGAATECRILETLADYGHGHCADPAHGVDEPRKPS
jgi:DNA-binding transcriptional MerR regulator